MTNIENKQQIIIEECYLSPHNLKDFDSEYTEKILPVFLCFSKGYIQKNFTSKIVKYRNAIERHNFPEDRTIVALISEHEAFKIKCLETGVTFFEIKEDYHKELMEVYDYIAMEKRKIETL